VVPAFASNAESASPTVLSIFPSSNPWKKSAGAWNPFRFGFLSPWPGLFCVKIGKKPLQAGKILEIKRNFV
jgi:hypothetical protein